MVQFRDPSKDKLKTNSVLREQYTLGKSCMLADCDKELSHFDGPGSNVLCREHQLQCAEYGGMGRPERPHTFYRNWICTKCNYDPRDDDLRFGHVEDEYKKIKAMRYVMHGDHIILKSHGGADSKDNINSLCVLCHSAKTAIEEDFLGTRKVDRS
tara:strand:+ start:507 stop:971 length:465 start_codon:yes stop_codon:yes gene_type:complete